MIRELRIQMFDLVMCFSDAVDLVSPAVANHHKRVAYIAQSIGAEVGLSLQQQNELVMAGAIHDFGALSLAEKLDALKFEGSFEGGKHPQNGGGFGPGFEYRISIEPSRR